MEAPEEAAERAQRRERAALDAAPLPPGASKLVNSISPRPRSSGPHFSSCRGKSDQSGGSLLFAGEGASARTHPVASSSTSQPASVISTSA